MPHATPSAATHDDAAPQGETPWGRLRAIIESLADGIVIVDSGGVIRFANPAAARLFSRSPDTLVGTSLGTPLVAGETTEMEIVRRGGGDLVYAELRVVDTEWEGEKVELVSLRDITDRKDAEERTKQLAHERDARLEAEAASRAKSDFLAIMSHELRTPLNAILGYSEIIELGITGELTDKTREHITRIRSSAKHLLVLVNDLLDLAKVEGGRLSVANAPAPVPDAIASALTLIQPQAEAKNLKLVVVPGADQLPAYIGDVERVRQILVILLSNAVKCTEAGGTISVEGTLATTPDPQARLTPRPAYIQLTVTDTGEGIPADKLKAIFEPFVQADTGPTRARGGSGLGLTIGLRLARAMGGGLTVESIMGKGSSFALWLPADVTDTTTAPARGAVIAPEGGGGAEASGIVAPTRDLKGLGDAARAVLSAMVPLVTSIVERICGDATLPMAKGLRTSQVSDHLSTLLTDIAGALTVIEEAAGGASPLLADAIEIQRLVSERHGVQRAGLGWTEAALRREFMIIREELERVIRRVVPPDGTIQAVDAIAMANRFVDQSEFVTVRALEKAREDD